jgi:hypothetical protein
MRPIRSAGAALAVALVLGLALPTTVVGALGLQVVPDVGQPGQTLAATATGFPPSQPVTFYWDAMTLVGPPVVADAQGTATLEFQIPASATLEAHFLRACQGSACPPGSPSQFYVDDTVTVVGPPTPAPTPAPTPVPTRVPTPAPSPTAAATPGPTDTPAPTETPAPTGPVVPIPSFPVAVPTPVPTPLPVVAVTPAPQPPDGEAVPGGPFPNLEVTGIEVTQGIQNLANSMPLVADRRTYARVYVKIDGALELSDVYGALEARRNGQQIGWIWPENGPIIGRASGGDRLRIDDTLNFRLPVTWLHGNVTLTTFVYAFDIDYPFTQEPIAEDNTRAVNVHFDPGDPLTIHLAPLHLHRSFHPTDEERTYDAFLQGGIATGNSLSTSHIVAGLWRYHPIAHLNVDSIGTIFPIGHANGKEWQLGSCNTSIIEWAVFDKRIASWHWLMEDDDVELEPGVSQVPDRDALYVLDRSMTITSFVPQADGTAEIFITDFAGSGPTPIVGAPAYVGGCKRDPDLSAEPNLAVALYRVFYDWSDERELFIGMVEPRLPTHWGGLSTGGTDTVWVRMRDETFTVSTWYNRGAATLAHEAGHDGGLKHVPCADGDEDGIPDELKGGDVDLSHQAALDFPDCSLAEIDPEGFYGFDVYWPLFGLPGPTVISNDPAEEAPNRGFPVLSYASPTWSDPYHYCRLLTYYGVFCSPDTAGIKWNAPDAPSGGPLAIPPEPVPAPPDGTQLLIVAGSLGEEPGGDTLEAVGAFDLLTESLLERLARQAALPDDERAGDLVVRDAGGGVLETVPVSDEIPEHGDPTPSDFLLVVPIAPGAAALELLDAAGAVRLRIDLAAGGAFELTGSATVTGTGPDATVALSWAVAGGAPEGLSYSVLFAPDGEHWQLLAAGLEATSYVFESLADLPDGEAETFRILAFDGARVVGAEVPVDLPGPRNPPRVGLDDSRSRRQPVNGELILEASVFDREDRTLPSDDIRWTSSIDGDLGSGGELRTRDLSPGTHEISVSATDGDGLVGSATIEVTVDSGVVAPRAGADLEAAVDRIFEALGSGASPAPASKDSRVKVQFAWFPAALIGLFALAGLLAIGALLRFRAAPVPPAETPTLMTGLAAGRHDPPKPKPAPPEPPSAEPPEVAGAPPEVPPAPGSGANEMSMDDTAGKERSSEGAVDSDVTLKGSKIKEN